MRKNRKISPQLRQRRVKDRRRTRRVFGLKEDANRWYRCHNCDFILDLRNNPEAFGDMYAKAGNYNVYNEDTLTPIPYGPDSQLNSGRDVTLAEIDASGDEKVVVLYPELNFVGCPLCGCRSNRT